MNLNTVQTDLTAWVETRSGLECEWGRLPQKHEDFSPFVLAYLGPLSKAGHDERIQSYDGGDDETDVRVVGVRRLALRLSFRSFDQRLGRSARQYAEGFRAALHTRDSFEELRAADLAFVDSDPLLETDYEWSGRLVSQVDLSVYLALRASFTDEDHDGSYIATVNSESRPYIVDEQGLPVLDKDGNYLEPES